MDGDGDVSDDLGHCDDDVDDDDDDDVDEDDDEDDDEGDDGCGNDDKMEM